MGEVRNLRTVATCRSSVCTAERRALLARLRKAIRIVAWFHDRCRGVWMEEEKYAETRTYEEVRRFLGAEHEADREPESAADSEPEPGAAAGG